MYHNFAKRISLCIGVILPVAVSAQNANKENSPYSRYGIGELVYGSNTVLRGMGYASTAYNSRTAINADNPASYAFLKSAVYEAGLTGSTRTIKTGRDNYSTGSATLAYLNIGIPVSKNAGFALGLRPQSRVYYNNVDSMNIDGLGRTAASYNGDGGLNYAYVGGAYKLKGFSLGVNAGYMFGTINNNATLQNIDTTNVLGSTFTTSTRIGGIYWKGGLQYETILSKKVYMRLGVTATMSQSLNADRLNQTVGVRYRGSTTYDTVYSSNNISGRIKLPSTYSAGVQFGGEKWSAIADYTTTNWSQYRSYDRVDSVVDRTMRISAGVEYTPNPGSVYKYLPRVTYRLGFYYGKDYVYLHNTELKYYALTAGVSLPFRRSADRVHIAAEYGKRGTLTNGMIQENFFRFTLGISLADNKWFIKRRYD